MILLKEKEWNLDMGKGGNSGKDKEHRNSMLGMFILAYARLDFTLTLYMEGTKSLGGGNFHQY